MRHDSNGCRADDVSILLRGRREALHLGGAANDAHATRFGASTAGRRSRPSAASLRLDRAFTARSIILSGCSIKIRQARNRVVLVSSESDRPITEEFLQRCPPQIAHWFSTNIQAKNEKLSVLPLGLANSYCGITLKAPLIAAHSRPFAERSRWLYVNFRTTSNPAAREPVLHHFRGLKRRGLGNGPGSRAGLSKASWTR